MYLHSYGKIDKRHKKNKSKKSRGKTKGKTKTQPTAKKNARAIKKLFKMSDPKYNYRMFNNELVADSTNWDILQLSNLAPSVLPATDQRQFLYRESDSVQARIRNIRIRFSVHAVSGREGGKIQKCYVALVKTTNGIGSTTGIHMPDVSAVFDPNSIDVASGNQLAPWEGFRATQGTPATGPTMSGPAIDSTTILKSWSCYLEPAGGDCHYRWDSTNEPPAVGAVTETDSGPPVLGGSNLNYTSTRPSQRFFTYTHNALGAVIKFANASSPDAINVKYFLVALSGNAATSSGFRINATCKINFYDN